MKVKLIMNIFFIAILFGCTNANEQMDTSKNDINPDSISNQHSNEPNKKYYQSVEEGISSDGEKQEIYATDEDREVAQLLAIRKDIKDSQVISMDDRIIVSVVLREPTDKDKDIVSDIEHDIQADFPNKKIIVFTDKLNWNRMKDLKASSIQRQAGENVEEFIEKYFNIEIKD